MGRHVAHRRNGAHRSSSGVDGATIRIKRRARRHYDVRFDAIWGGIFRFGETIRLNTHPTPPTTTQPAKLTFDDTHDLGWLAGGKYQFSGEATQDQFTCQYKSSSDHGTFEMKRVVRRPDPAIDFEPLDHWSKSHLLPPADRIRQDVAVGVFDVAPGRADRGPGG